MPVLLGLAHDVSRKPREDGALTRAQDPAHRRISEANVYTRAEQKRRREARRLRIERAATTGGVYFVEAVGLKKVKIGYAIDVKKRLAALATNCPTPLRLMAFVQGPRELEFTLHIRFWKCHSHLEWFHLRKPILDFIGQGPAQYPAHPRKES